MENDEEPAIEPSVAPRGWSPGHKVAFRFACIYLLLYNLPFPAGWVPKTEWIGALFFRVWSFLARLVSEHVFGAPVDFGFNGSGDTTANYVLAFTMVMLAVAGAVVWTLADRRRVDYRRIDRALRVYLRYVLGLTMVSYGVSKVFKTQFPFPSDDRLMSTYGDGSPMGLLWTMMGYSYGYNLFTGAVEVLGGMLLLWRRTALLGSLVSAGALANIVALNFCYDVPVKLYSIHLLLLSVYVMAPDLGRLARMFVLNRPVPAQPARAALPPRWEWARRGVKTAFIGWMVYSLVGMELDVRKHRDQRERDPAIIHGLFAIDRQVTDGAERPQTDANRWRSIGFARGGAVVRTMDRTWIGFEVTSDAHTHVMLLTPDAGGAPIAMIYTQPDPDHLALTGVLDKHLVELRGTKQDVSNLQLVTRGFHWINEYPLNR